MYIASIVVYYRKVFIQSYFSQFVLPGTRRSAFGQQNGHSQLQFAVSESTSAGFSIVRCLTLKHHTLVHHHWMEPENLLAELRPGDASATASNAKQLEDKSDALAAKSSAVLNVSR